MAKTSRKKSKGIYIIKKRQEKPVQPETKASEPPIRFVIARKKKLAELTVDDIPPGMTPEMVASDWPPWRWSGR